MSSTEVKAAIERGTDGLQLKALIGKQFEVAIPVGDITPAGIEELKAFLRQAGLPEPADGDIEWKWKTPRGTLPKRILKWLEKAHKREPAQKVIADLGALASRLTGDSTVYRFLITPPPFKWRDGYYGKSNSCWWSQGQKEYWEVMDGHAVLFYNNKGWKDVNGVGRIWILQLGERVCLLLNGYFDGDEKTPWTQKLTQVVATGLGVSYVKIAVTSSRMHINSNTGYLIGLPHDLTAFTEPLPLADGQRQVRLDPPEIRKVYCASCNLRLLRQEDEHIGGAAIYCAACHELTFFHCGKCGAAANRAARYVIGGESWCLRCRNAHLFNCDGCGELFTVNEALKVGPFTYCQPCFGMHTFSCEGCHKRRPSLASHVHKPTACPLCGDCPDQRERQLCTGCFVNAQSFDPARVSLI